MPMRRKRQQRVEGPPRRRPRTARRAGTRRRLWVASIALLLPLALVLAAFVAPIGQARPASERSPEEAAQILVEKAALRAEREADRKARRRAKLPTGGERENVVIKTSCTHITWAFRGFPDLPGNTVTLKLKINKVVTWSTYSFDGPTSTLEQEINAPPGKFKIDTRGMWRTNGFKGDFDIGVGVLCEPAPAFTLEKLQRIGDSGSYTTSQLTGEVGQTVDYKFLVSNTGNVPLTLSALSDARCDEGTIGGGPGGTLAVGASTTYTCTHLLTAADLSAGSLSNTVTLTGTPPEGEGAPVEHTSNTVVVEVVPKPPPTEPETPPVNPPPGPGTPGSPPSSGVAASSTAQSPQVGVLALKQSAVPALKVSLPRLSGPQGCVRSSFRASVKSKGVASVGFYMDGHKLKTMSAKSARNGKITIVIDPSTLKVGAHKLMAKITMAKTSSSSKAAHGTRTATVLRCRAAVLTPRFTG